MKCRICEREATTEYCEFHEKAFENLTQQFSIWKKALEISWKGFLNEIIKNPYTGAWVKEVAESLLSEKSN